MSLSQDLAIGLALGFLVGMLLFARWKSGLGCSPLGCALNLLVGLLCIGIGLCLLVVGGYVR